MKQLSLQVQRYSANISIEEVHEIQIANANETDEHL